MKQTEKTIFAVAVGIITTAIGSASLAWFKGKRDLKVYQTQISTEETTIAQNQAIMDEYDEDTEEFIAAEKRIEEARERIGSYKKDIEKLAKFGIH